MRPAFAAVALLVSLAVMLGGALGGDGGDDVYIRHYSMPASQAGVSATATATAAPANDWLTWELPATWQELAAGDMAFAQFAVQNEAGEGVCKLFLLPPQGRLANINRWRRQLDLPPITDTELPDQVQTDQNGFGSFIWLALANPAIDDRAFLAAMVEREQQVLFVKLQLPRAALQPAQDGFVAFCRSLRPSEEAE
jgi:hypothetical protein